MNCERARELIIDALVEPLDTERAAKLREHTVLPSSVLPTPVGP